MAFFPVPGSPSMMTEVSAFFASAATCANTSRIGAEYPMSPANVGSAQRSSGGVGALLDLSDLRGQRGLRHMATLRRAMKAELVGDGDDVLELPNREVVRGGGHD